MKGTNIAMAVYLLFLGCGGVETRETPKAEEGRSSSNYFFSVKDTNWFLDRIIKKIRTENPERKNNTLEYGNLRISASREDGIETYLVNFNYDGRAEFALCIDYDPETGKLPPYDEYTIPRMGINLRIRDGPMTEEMSIFHKQDRYNVWPPLEFEHDIPKFYDFVEAIKEKLSPGKKNIESIRHSTEEAKPAVFASTGHWTQPYASFLNTKSRSLRR